MSNVRNVSYKNDMASNELGLATKQELIMCQTTVGGQIISYIPKLHIAKYIKKFCFVVELLSTYMDWIFMGLYI